MEMELWNLFHSARAPNATLILSVIIGIWITARFSSVARENNAPVLMKGIISVFALAMASFILATVSTSIGGFFVKSAYAVVAIDELTSTESTPVELPPTLDGETTGPDPPELDTLPEFDLGTSRFFARFLIESTISLPSSDTITT